MNDSKVLVGSTWADQKRHNVYLGVTLGFLVVVFGFLLHFRGVKWGIDLPPEIQISRSNETYTVTEITVLAGNEFDLKLENGKRIHAKLLVTPVPDAKQRVITYLNQIQNPRIVVLGRQGDTWMIDLYVRTESQASLWEEVSLTKWLKENELVWVDL